MKWKIVPVEATPEMVLADEGRSNAFHWYERAQTAETEVKRLRAELAARDAECARLRDALVAIGLDDPKALRSRIDCEVCDGEESQCVASCWVRLGSAALDGGKPKEPKS